MLVDSHCHLDFEVFDDDRGVVIDRARQAGVGTLLTICTRVSRFNDILAIATGSGEDIWCSVGIHPHHTEEEPEIAANELVSRSRHPKVVGIGETGLDYHYDNSPREIQKRSFRAHIAAARESGLPLIVHNRESDGDMAQILEEEMAAGQFSAVLHCFSSSRELAEAAVDLGFYVSFSGILTFKNAEELRDIAAELPLDRLLVETDSPFLAPVPNRGRRNEPSFVVHTAAELARIRNVEMDEIMRITTDNFYRLFDKIPRCATV